MEMLPCANRGDEILRGVWKDIDGCFNASLVRREDCESLLDANGRNKWTR